MRYDDECPSPWKARQEGDWAGHRGWGSNPYREQLGESYCEDADRAWRNGYHSGEEQRREEEAQEAAAQRYQAERAAEEQAWEDARWEAYYQEEQAAESET